MKETIKTPFFRNWIYNFACIYDFAILGTELFDEAGASSTGFYNYKNNTYLLLQSYLMIN